MNNGTKFLVLVAFGHWQSMDDRDDLTERRYQVGGMIQGRKNQVWVIGQARGELAHQDVSMTGESEYA